MRNYCVTLILLFVTLSLTAQKSDYQLFKDAIGQLQTANSEIKEATIQQAKASSDSLTNTTSTPNVIALGGTTKQNQALEEAAINALKAMGLNGTGSTNDIPSQNTPEYSKIKFETKTMFPDEPSGTVYEYSEEIPKTDEIEWVTSEVITTTEVIEIEDIKNPEERKKWQTLARHQTNIATANEIGFIEAIHKECANEATFSALIANLKKEGYDFTPYFKQAKVLDNDKEKISFIKSKIEALVNKVIYE